MEILHWERPFFILAVVSSLELRNEILILTGPFPYLNANTILQIHQEYQNRNQKTGFLIRIKLRITLFQFSI